jgi:aspartyl/asparaginyl beta-hydroxylase (cupin superfamily)
MFVDTCQFDFVAGLGERWQVISEELVGLDRTEFTAWQETHLYKTGWDVFGLYAFGKKLPENCARVPRTTALIEHIPGMVSAGFSSMQPMTHIAPHFGYSYDYSDDGKLTTERVLNQGVLRLHLGLIVPPTLTELGCAIRVGEHVAAWREGECLCFDDALDHEAWNRSQGTRVVLIVDFKPAQSVVDPHAA